MGLSFLFNPCPSLKQTKQTIRPPKISGWKRIYFLLECHFFFRCELLVFSWRLIAGPKGDFIFDVQVPLWVVREDDSSTPETKTYKEQRQQNPDLDIPLDQKRDQIFRCLPSNPYVTGEDVHPLYALNNQGSLHSSKFLRFYHLSRVKKKPEMWSGWSQSTSSWEVRCLP